MLKSMSITLFYVVFIYLLIISAWFILILPGIIIIGGLLFVVQSRIIFRESNFEVVNNLVTKFEKNEPIDDELKKIYKWNIFARFVAKKIILSTGGKNRTKNKKTFNKIIKKHMLVLNITILDEQSLKTGWKKQSKIFHPDKFTDETDKARATERFQEISTSYEILKKIIKDNNV